MPCSINLQNGLQFRQIQIGGRTRHIHDRSFFSNDKHIAVDVYFSASQYLTLFQSLPVRRQHRCALRQQLALAAQPDRRVPAGETGHGGGNRKQCQINRAGGRFKRAQHGQLVIRYQIDTRLGINLDVRAFRHRQGPASAAVLVKSYAGRLTLPVRQHAYLGKVVYIRAAGLLQRIVIQYQGLA